MGEGGGTRVSSRNRPGSFSGTLCLKVGSLVITDVGIFPRLHTDNEVTHSSHRVHFYLLCNSGHHETLQPISKSERVKLQRAADRF